MVTAEICHICHFWKEQAPTTFRAEPAGLRRELIRQVTDQRDRIPSTVAIIIPCHNYGRYLGEAIESVLAQTHRATEIAVVDDASTDDTAEVAKSFAERGVGYYRVQYYHSQQTRRAGVAFTFSEVLCFLDADDRLAPDYLQRGLEQFTAAKIGIVYSDVLEFGLRNGRSNYPSEFDPRRMVHMNFMHTGCLVLREALMISRAVDVATDDQKSLQDWLLWRRVLQFGWTARKQSGLYHYRRHGESMTIDWPSWTDNPSDYFARAALEKEVITLFIPLSGREALWPGLARYLERQTWPRDQTRLILMDTSQNAAFSKEVRRWIAGCDYVDVRHVCEAVAQRGIAELPRLQFAADVSLAMARIYNRMVREITTEYVWVLEDDIVPPPDACSRLLQGFDADTVSVTAAYRSRFGNAYVAWEHNQRRVETKGVGLQVIGGNGFGCVLLRSHALRETVFTATVDYAGYDNAFYHRLRRTGATAKIDWAVECDHLCTSD